MRLDFRCFYVVCHRGKNLIPKFPIYAALSGILGQTNSPVSACQLRKPYLSPTSEVHAHSVSSKAGGSFQCSLLSQRSGTGP